MSEVDKTSLERSSKWFAAQPDKSRVKVDFTFGKGNFTVSQWSKHNMYSGVTFEDSGISAGPDLVAPPMTPISLVDGLGTIISSKIDTLSEEESKKTAGIRSLTGPQAVDVILSVSQPVWEFLDADDLFQKCRI
ncbi:hypothetical protein ACHAPI_010145 [Fusarium lateritium]